MQKKITNNWSNLEALDSLLFFSYLIDEMSFNYTIDTFKAPALNSKSLCLELINTIDNISSQTIAKGALNSIKDELAWSLEFDRIILRLIPERRLNLYIKNIKNENDIKLLRSQVEIILLSINNKYFDEQKKALSELINENREKEKIESITRSFVTELQNQGFSNEYIYYTNREFFFNKDKPINNLNELNEFFNKFNKKEGSSKYKAIFLGSKIFKELKAPSEALGFKVLESFNDLPENVVISKYIEKFAQNRIYIYFEEIKSYDPYSARNIAHDKIEKVSSLFAFFHHKTELKWRAESIIWNNDLQTIISKPSNSILNCKDLRPRKASLQLNKTIQSFGLTSDSFHRVDKSIEFHDTAIKSKSLENQFVNLFTALEILIPKQKDSNKDRIIQIVDVLTPFLFLDYNQKLFNHLVKCVSEWNYQYLRDILRNIQEGNGNTEKMCAFISLSKYDHLRGTYLQKLHDENYSILKNRIYKLNKIYSTTKTLQKHLSIHEKRVKWHIERIYRIRNLIVHTGTLPRFTETVVENLHSYYDIVINNIFQLAINNEHIRTLEHVYLEKELYYKDYKNIITNNINTELNETNFLEFLLNKK